jgi:hypothetical protein
MSTWPKLSPREFLAAVGCLGTEQVQQIDLDLDPCVTTPSGQSVDYRLVAPRDDIEAGLRRCLALRCLEVRRGSVSRSSGFLWSNFHFAWLSNLTLTGVSLMYGSLQGLPNLRVLHLFSCTTGDLALPLDLRELHVIRDQKIPLGELLHVCASVESMSVVSYLCDRLQLDHRALLTLCRRSQALRSLTVQSAWLPRASDELRSLMWECTVACPSLQTMHLRTESSGNILNQVVLQV